MYIYEGIIIFKVWLYIIKRNLFSWKLLMWLGWFWCRVMLKLPKNKHNSEAFFHAQDSKEIQIKDSWQQRLCSYNLSIAGFTIPIDQLVSSRNLNRPRNAQKVYPSPLPVSPVWQADSCDLIRPVLDRMYSWGRDGHGDYNGMFYIWMLTPAKVHFGVLSYARVKSGGSYGMQVCACVFNVCDQRGASHEICEPFMIKIL